MQPAVQHGSTLTARMHVTTAAPVNVATERLAPLRTGASGLMLLSNGSSCTSERRHTGLTAFHKMDGLLRVCGDLC